MHSSKTICEASIIQENEEIQRTKMLRDIEELFLLKRQNFELENKLILMEEQKGFWSGVKSHLIYFAGNSEASNESLINSETILHDKNMKSHTSYLNLLESRSKLVSKPKAGASNGLF